MGRARGFLRSSDSLLRTMSQGACLRPLWRIVIEAVHWFKLRKEVSRGWKAEVAGWEQKTTVTNRTEYPLHTFFCGKVCRLARQQGCFVALPLLCRRIVDKILGDLLKGRRRQNFSGSPKAGESRVLAHFKAVYFRHPFCVYGCCYPSGLAEG